MRWLPLLLLAACDWTQPDTAGPHSGPVPDASTCYTGQFQIVAPVEGQHYAPSMVVHIDEVELWAALTLTMTDDLGTSYDYYNDDSVPYQPPSGPTGRHDSFYYNLAPSHRYVLTVSHGCGYDDASVTFFTSAQ